MSTANLPGGSFGRGQSGADFSAHTANPPINLHLWTALIVMILVVGLLSVTQQFVKNALPKRMASFASHDSALKLTGNVLQTAAFQMPATLPIYGSSELDHPAGNRPDRFFESRPSGFAVFPIGRGGTTCLLMLQKIAAVGRMASGKRAVFFLSPSWFNKEGVGENAVDANLTSPQLSAWVFGGLLSQTLQQKIARRLRDYPESLRDQPLLNSAVDCLAEPTSFNRFRLACLTPLGRAQNAVFQQLESCGILREMIIGQGKRNRQPTDAVPAPQIRFASGKFDWPRMAEEAENADRARDTGGVYSATNALIPVKRRAENLAHQAVGSRDEDFRDKLLVSKEFNDLKLLLDVLKELRVRPLFISQPLNGIYRDIGGTSKQGRRIYYETLANVMHPSGYPLLTFSEHEEDRFFFNDANHPSAKAWIYYDQAIDQFYHAGQP